MYCPDAFQEDRVPVLHAFIAEHPLGLLVSGGAGAWNCDPVPFLVDPAPAPLGTLRVHVARANPHWRALAEDGRCLVVFLGPQAYVTPSWYPSKLAHGKVVPTWNYAVVEARGVACIIQDPVWLRRQIDDLTALSEATRAQPWSVADAPAAFTDTMLRGIVGIEIPLTALCGKLKASQNRPEDDRRGVVRGLGPADPMTALVAAGPRTDT